MSPNGASCQYGNFLSKPIRMDLAWFYYCKERQFIVLHACLHPFGVLPTSQFIYTLCLKQIFLQP